MELCSEKLGILLFWLKSKVPFRWRYLYVGQEIPQFDTVVDVCGDWREKGESFKYQISILCSPKLYYSYKSSTKTFQLANKLFRTTDVIP